MNNFPRISIVLPVHNESAWLTKCVDSLLAQSYPDCEIIFVDDASTDTSWHIIQSFQTTYPEKIRSFHFTKNCGEGAVRNKGIELASGVFIIETDADTIFPTDFVSTSYNIYQSTNADGLSLGYLKIHPDRKGILAHYWQAKREASRYNRMNGKKEAVASMYFFKKETALTIGGYDASVPSGTDFDFGMRARQHGFTIASADEVFFYHADVTNWWVFYKRLFNAARYDMPVQKRWGRWLTPTQALQKIAHGIFATVLLLLGLYGFYNPLFFFAWLILFLLEGIAPLVFHKETRMIVKILAHHNYWLTVTVLPFITFIRVRASNYGKMYAIFFPQKTIQSITFDV